MQSKVLQRLSVSDNPMEYVPDIEIKLAEPEGKQNAAASKETTPNQISAMASALPKTRRRGIPCSSAEGWTGTAADLAARKRS